MLDYHGTLARNAVLLAGVPERLRQLAKHLELRVVTGDTFGQAATHLSDLRYRLMFLPGKGQPLAKRAHIEKLGDDRTVVIGNGFNDRLMLPTGGGIIDRSHPR